LTLAIRTRAAEEADEFLDKIQADVPREAAAKAGEFLERLRAEAEEEIRDVCASTLSEIVGKVCFYEDRNLFKDEHGILHQRVASPLYGDQVVRLFSRHPNPVIRLHPQRPAAADF
jgi:hypothetical protein